MPAKNRKTDHDTVSKQDHEIRYFKSAYNVKADDVLAAMAEVGKGRKKVMAYLQAVGLIIEKPVE